MNILIQLNFSLRDNYAFMDAEAPLCLNMSNPRGFAPRLTRSILNGLRFKTLIDVNNVVDIEEGRIREIAPIQQSPIPAPIGDSKSPSPSDVPQNGAKEKEVADVIEPKAEPLVIADDVTDKKTNKKATPIADKVVEDVKAKK